MTIIVSIFVKQSVRKVKENFKFQNAITLQLNDIESKNFIYNIAPNVGSTFYSFFNFEKLRCVFNLRYV
jgi:hypothetical protein